MNSVRLHLNNNPNKRHYERPWGAGKFPIQLCWMGRVHPRLADVEPDTLRSPPLEACNSRWALDLYQQTYDRGYIMDTMYWNGKGDDAEVWKGICRQVMWIMQTEHHRLFTPSGATRAVTMDRDYLPLLQAAREIHENAVLKKFWQHGNLVTNRWTRDFDEIPVDGNGDTSTGYGHLTTGQHLRPIWTISGTLGTDGFSSMCHSTADTKSRGHTGGPVAGQLSP
jgi:hypothetical protein